MKTLSELIEDRIRQTGDISPGNYNLAADILITASVEASNWTHRPDDAVRIPDVLWEASAELRRQAKNIDNRPPKSK